MRNIEALGLMVQIGLPSRHSHHSEDLLSILPNDYKKWSNTIAEGVPGTGSCSRNTTEGVT